MQSAAALFFVFGLSWPPVQAVQIQPHDHGTFGPMFLINDKDECYEANPEKVGHHQELRSMDHPNLHTVHLEEGSCASEGYAVHHLDVFPPYLKPKPFTNERPPLRFRVYKASEAQKKKWRVDKAAAKEKLAREKERKQKKAARVLEQKKALAKRKAAADVIAKKRAVNLKVKAQKTKKSPIW